MSKRVSQIPSALKHGIYSGMTLLPGEDPEEFEKFHKELIAEYGPEGPSERDIVSDMARLLWRKKNLFMYGVAERARLRHSSIYYKLERLPEIPILSFGVEPEKRGPDELKALWKQANEKAERELGAAQELVKIGDVATTEHLLEELSLMERLDGMFDRCLKRFLFIRGLKSLSSELRGARSQSAPKLLT